MSSSSGPGYDFSPTYLHTIESNILKNTFALLPLAILGALLHTQAAQAQAAVPAPVQDARLVAYPYAFEDCKSGCVSYENFSGGNVVVFSGTQPKTYRICAAENSRQYHVTISVDKRVVTTRQCMDVNGATITLDSGKAHVGRLPE